MKMFKNERMYNSTRNMKKKVFGGIWHRWLYVKPRWLEPPVSRCLLWRIVIIIIVIIIVIVFIIIIVIISIRIMIMMIMMTWLNREIMMILVILFIIFSFLWFINHYFVSKLTNVEMIESDFNIRVKNLIEGHFVKNANSSE